MPITAVLAQTVPAELDSLISQVPHTHFITGPVFGPPTAAAKGDLVLVLSGDYRSKKIVAYLSVPAMARKVMDMGGNVEKGIALFSIGIRVPYPSLRQPLPLNSSEMHSSWDQ
jgi:hypothetical protein